MHRVLVFLSLCFCALTAHAAEWPEGFIVHERSTSPDGHYGVLIPKAEDAGDDLVNYLADLQAHKVIGKLDRSDYFENANHRALTVTWSADSTFCVLEYSGRFGFGTINLVEIEAGKLRQTEIGEKIQGMLNAAIAKQARSKGEECDAGAYTRTGPGRKVRIRAIGTTNPKGIESMKTYLALFQGSYDVAAHKWSVTDARAIPATAQDDFYGAYADADLTGEGYEKDEEREKALDDQLNAAYRTVRAIIPPARFAKVKAEQVAWLKSRDAVSGSAERCRLLTARIKVLQDLLW